MTFEGRKADGSEFVVTFSLDGVHDGTGPLADFQTFEFPAYFENLVELRSSGAYYFMDNLVVTVHGTETVVAPLTPPLIYDIDWNEAPHQLNQPMSTGGQRAAATSNFGIQYVRGAIGPLTDRPLELSAAEAMYDQIGLEAGYNATRYVLEFDTAQTSTTNTLAVFFDHTSGFVRTDIHGSGAIEFNNFTPQGGPQGTIPSATHNAQAAAHFRMEFDAAARQVTIALGGAELASFTLPGSGLVDLKTVRFNVAGQAVVGLDNLRLTAEEPVPLAAVPADAYFLSQTIGTSATTPLRLFNVGSVPVTVTGAVSTHAAFSLVDAVFPVEVEPGESAIFTLKGQPVEAGFAFGRIEFTSSAGAVFVTTSTKGEEPIPPGPRFLEHPASRLVDSGQTITLRAILSEPVKLVEWTRDDVVIPGTSQVLSITQAKLTDAGVYRMRAERFDGTSLYSSPANVGVVAPQSLTRTIPQGGQAEAEASAAGPGLTFVWRSPTNAVLTGSEQGIEIDGAKLAVSPATTAMSGYYIATAVMPNAGSATSLSRQALVMNLQVLLPPSIVTQTLQHWQVGVEGSVRIFTTLPVTSMTATGLPPGLVFDSTTKFLSGTPTADAAPPGSTQAYQITFQARNSVGEGPPVTLECLVHSPLQTSLNFTGLLAPGVLSADSHQLGGRIRITLQKTGAFTAVAKFAHTSLSATGQLNFRAADGALAGSIIFKRAPAVAFPVRLDREMRFESEYPAGLLSALPCLRRLDPEVARPGLYPTALLATDPGSDPGIDTPAGTGILQARLTPSARLNYTAKLADGSVATGSEDLAADGGAQIAAPLFAGLGGRGALRGWVTLKGSMLDGQLIWKKVGTRYDKSYPQGFADVAVEAVGDLFAPSPGDPVAQLGITGAQSTVTFTDAGLTESLTSVFDVSTAGRVKRLSGSTATLALQRSTATFSGTVNVGLHRGIPVRASYSGVLVPRLGRGVGFFICPDLSQMRGYSSSSSYYSGPVVLMPEEGAP